MGKTIGIVSLKGGVGKTSVAVSLADTLTNLGKSVLLIDGNFSAPNIGLHLNIIEPENTIHHVLSGDSNISEAVYNINNFDVIPGLVFSNKNFSPMKFRNKIKYLKNKYDIILVDSSPRLDEETLAVMMACDEILTVATPDYSTLANTISAVKLAKRRKTPIAGIVLNKVHNKKFEIPLKNIEKTTDVPVMAVIPHDINILKAQAQFIPYTSHKPKSNATREFHKLASTISGTEYNSRKNLKDILRKLKPKPQDMNRTIYYQKIFQE